MKPIVRQMLTRGLLACAALLLVVVPAAAEPRTTSDLLLPYFEVDLGGGARTTLFALGNGHGEAVDVQVAVSSNWGIPVLRLALRLGPGQVVTVNLRDWVGHGRLPGQTLGEAPLAHLQAALTGEPSPKDGLYYATPIEPGLAVGFVTFRVAGTPRPDALWGDTFWVDAAGEAAEGVLLVDVGRTSRETSLCDRHLVRFVNPEALRGTDLVLWTGRYAAPSPIPEPGFIPLELAAFAFYREDGSKFDERVLGLPPVSLLSLPDLVLAERSGWIDLVSDVPIFVATRFNPGSCFAVAVESWCQRETPPAPHFVARPGLDLEKLTEGTDADSPPGPVLEVGSTVTWQYVVTNTGNVAIGDIVVSDDRGVVVHCPATSLGAGRTMTCTGSGTVRAGSYVNVGTVTGNPPEGPPVTDSDPSHHRGLGLLPDLPAIDLEKMTNGQPADTPPGPTLGVGDLVTWSYSVTNVGGMPLVDVVVADSDPAVVVQCPRSTLGLAETMLCTASGTAVLGQYANTATASAVGGGIPVSAEDPSHYYGVPEPPPATEPAIEIEKLTNGFDADGVASAPHLFHGHPVLWTYVISNSGDTVLSDVTVTDDREAEVSCPKTVLQPGEQMICTASGTAVASEECYANVGTVVGTPPAGDDVTDSDPSHYCAQEVPGTASIALEKTTNGEDADLPPGPSLLVGDNVQWAYAVTNTGEVTLTGVTVTDDQGESITCSAGQPFTLAPGATTTCLANGVAVAGQYANVGTASGTPEGGGDAVSASDPSHYFAVLLGNQGCTPGYWKNHTDSWPPTGYSTGQAVEDVFSAASAYPAQGTATLLEALSFAGGSGVEGAVEILLRAGVAALLNAAHPEVAYPQTTAEVLSSVNAALASGSRDAMLFLAAGHDADNNRGCPLH